MRCLKGQMASNLVFSDVIKFGGVGGRTVKEVGLLVYVEVV